MQSTCSRGALYLIPVPIAPLTHAQVLPASMQEIISQINHFLVENVKIAKRFLYTMDPSCSLSAMTFVAINNKTTQQDIRAAITPLYQGENIGILSEAGCPGIADPGSIVVAYAHQHGLKVVPVVGPCSLVLALMASGFNGQNFAFHGYLPIKQEDREKSIRTLEKIALRTGQTQIFIETPYRNQALLASLLQVCAPQTRLCIARHLTASDGWVRSCTIQNWKKQEIDLHKVPVVFLLAP